MAFLARMRLIGETVADDMKPMSVPAGPEVRFPTNLPGKKSDECRDGSGSEAMTTDVGSDSSSDSDGTSSTSSVLNSRCRSASIGDVGSLGVRRRSSLLHRPTFGGTTLETIPGTPAASASETHVVFHAATLSKKDAREATVAKATRAGVPLKVRLPAHVLARTPPTDADLALPVYKRPAFADSVGPALAAAMLRLEAGKPVKKCVTGFLLEDTLKLIPLPPGLTLQQICSDKRAETSLTIGQIRSALASPPPGLTQGSICLAR